MKKSISRSLYLALSGASIVALAATGSAHADRKRAPIVYAGGGSASPSTPVQSQMPTGPASVTEQRRVEFRYPDQPIQTEGAVPVQAVPTFDQPISFSPVATDVMSDPAPAYLAPANTDLLAGGTAASAAAPRLEFGQGRAPTQPIRIASVQPQTVANTGKPLTLSRVRANRAAPVSEETGPAGLYMDGFNGQPTANGEIFDETAMTAAHPSLPLPSLVQVINQDNRREVVVRVNDRGPFDGKRVLELSPRAGTVLGINKGQTANVRVRYLGPAPVQQNKDSYATTQVEDESLPPVQMPAPAVNVATYNAPAVSDRSPLPPVNVSAPAAYGNIYIQAGAFSDIANAQSLTSALGRGLSVKIEEARVDGGDYFRVLIGPFSSMDAAEVQRSQLSRAGIVDGFLTKR